MAGNCFYSKYCDRELVKCMGVTGNVYKVRVTHTYIKFDFMVEWLKLYLQKTEVLDSV